MNSPYKGKFKVTQIFKGRPHKGIDLVGVTSKDIFSPVSGTVEAARRDVDPNDPNNANYGMGNYVRIKDEKTGLLHYLAHLSKITVRQGQAVKKGDQVGVEGSTGHSTGSHLHYEVRSKPDNTTFQNVSEISGIPNELGAYEQEDITVENEIKDTNVTIGNTEVPAKLIDGVTWVPVRDLVDAIKSELEVTWDKAKGAGVDL